MLNGFDKELMGKYISGLVDLIVVIDGICAWFYEIEECSSYK
jgi:hypothetical protein